MSNIFEMAFLQFLRSTFFILILLTSLSAKAQVDSIAMSEEYYNMGMEVFDFTHRKQAAEDFVLSTQMNPKTPRHS
jgi:hypothetical protein